MPRRPIFGEEYGERQRGSPLSRRWIVDPIDGTKGYVRGLPVWATLLALEEDGEVTRRGRLGAGDAAALVGVGRAAARSCADAAGGVDRGGCGCRRRDARPTRSSPTAASRNGGDRAGWTGLLALADGAGARAGFGDFWQYMLVAEGGAEICADPTVSLWDLAAPMMVVQEAGGRFTDFTGAATADGGDAIASNGLLQRSLASRR